MAVLNNIHLDETQASSVMNKAAPLPAHAKDEAGQEEEQFLVFSLPVTK